jgi:hypothetical protein
MMRHVEQSRFCSYEHWVRTPIDNEEITNNIPCFHEEGKADAVEFSTRASKHLRISHLTFSINITAPEIAVFLMDVRWAQYKRPKNIEEYVDLMVTFLSAVHHTHNVEAFGVLNIVVQVSYNVEDLSRRSSTKQHNSKQKER